MRPALTAQTPDDDLAERARPTSRSSSRREPASAAPIAYLLWTAAIGLPNSSSAVCALSSNT
jgi:hypothetical protein